MTNWYSVKLYTIKLHPSTTPWRHIGGVKV